MMRSRLILCLALLASACGGVDDADTTPFTLSEREPRPASSSGSLSLEEYLRESAHLSNAQRCAEVYRAGRPRWRAPATDDRALAAGSEVACRQLPELFFDVYDNDLLGWWVSAGVYRYDPEAAASCLEQRRAIREPLLSDLQLSEACSRVFVGALREGDGCNIDDECEGALVCEGQSLDGGCVGRCAVNRCGDEVCEEDERCSEGQGCQRIFNGICRADLSPCPEGSTCVEGRCRAPQAPRKGRGEPCSYELECEAVLSCVAGRCVVPQRAGEGEPCGGLGDDSIQCVQPYICDRLGAEGGRCIRAGAFGAACQHDFHCDHLHACREGRCGALRRLGELCDDGQVIYAPHCEAKGVCAAGAQGEAPRCQSSMPRWVWESQLCAPDRGAERGGALSTLRR